MSLNSIKRWPANEAGCYVDGHWGQYGVARVIEIAIDCGWDDEDAADLAQRHLASMGPSVEPRLTDDEYGQLVFCSDEAECWLNEYVADSGCKFYWDDGEFFYEHISDTCQYCGQEISKYGDDWLDISDGDSCSGNIVGDNEGEPHRPTRG